MEHAHELSETKDMPQLDTIFGVPEGQDARVLADLAREKMANDSVIVHVALDDARCESLHDALTFFAPDVEIVRFPAWDCLPYDRVSPSADIVAQRVSTLCIFLGWQSTKARKPRIVLTTVNAALQKVMPQAALENASLNFVRGGRVSEDDLFNYLTGNGYHRTDTVREPGEYAVRGGIIDIYPADADHPVRLDLFGDEIESLKSFDALSQRSLDQLENFSLTPASEYFLSKKQIDTFRSNYRKLFGVPHENDALYHAISEGRNYNGAEHWLPLFYEEMASLFDYLPAYFVTHDYHGVQAQEERLSHIADYYDTRKSLETVSLKKTKDKNGMEGAIYRPIPPALLFAQEVIARDAIFSPFRSEAQKTNGGGASKARNFADIRALPDGNVFAAVKETISTYQAQKKRVLIAAYSEGSRARLKTILESEHIANIVTCDNFKQASKAPLQQISLVVLSIESGFVADDIAVLTEQDILGDRLTRTLKKKKKVSDNFIAEASSLQQGDLVIHSEHGLGRFEGLETLQAAGVYHDCVKLVYLGGDKLYVPIENIEVLSRYGDENTMGQLDKLGGAGWQARKAKVKKDLLRIAEHLMKIAAARHLKKGEKIHVAEEPYNKFVAGFPYVETNDQQRAIDAVIEDMQSGRPMDRLVCGDVGFGKTEIALRAAAVAALDGLQVAVIAPTTLLVRQHYQGFVERFKNMGLRVVQLSRLVSQADAKSARDEIAKGTANIVIGTHALLSKETRFSNLGLMIIDEEQRFGVKQKERLKEIKENVHVLTLTATPIPRTLQMALTGVKDMSIIATPPVDRLAIRTFVLPYDPVVIREALLREHYRGGQSFYVCPRVSDIADLEEALKELVPEVRVVAAHGQMSSNELEAKMNAFIDKQYDVLLATNIIESGLDIPTANTMIVHRADMFGLSQLYQIRGRIGRSKVRAYAYLTTEPAKRLTDTAQKRLEVLEMLDTLGAGFQLASHDMDIRGAGNLVGEEQSGHIKEVGVELYQQMLEEAVAMVKAGVDEPTALGTQSFTPQINLGTSILIPENYVQDLSVRMSLYRRLSELDEQEEIEAFAAEMIDRFGALPDEVENLLDIVKIKQLCKKAGIDKLDAGPKGAVIGFHNNLPPNPEALIAWIDSKRGTVKLRPDQKISLLKSWSSVSQRVSGIRAVLTELSGL